MSIEEMASAPTDVQPLKVQDEALVTMTADDLATVPVADAAADNQRPAVEDEPEAVDQASATGEQPALGDLGSRNHVAIENTAPTPDSVTADGFAIIASAVVLEPHPYATAYPPIEGDEFAALKADIAANGLRQPIVLCEGKILDGCNRYRACRETGVAVKCVDYEDNDPFGFVLSVNTHRRHLSASQRAMVAAKLEIIRHGGDRWSVQAASLHHDRGHVAKKLNVSTRSVASAARVRDHAIPELAQRVERGDTSVSLAAKAALLPPDKQRKLVEEIEAGLRPKVQVAKPTKPQINLAEAIRHASQQRSQKLYGLIYADPPWPGRPCTQEPNDEGDADDPLSVSALDALRTLNVPAADDAVLYLWTTMRTIPDALSVITAWGFQYKLHIVWVKSAGRWNQDLHELLLIATRGNVPTPATGEEFQSVCHAAEMRDGAKPEALLSMIKDLFPGLPAVDLFGDRYRPGWDMLAGEVTE